MGREGTRDEEIKERGAFSQINGSFSEEIINRKYLGVVC